VFALSYFLLVPYLILPFLLLRVVFPVSTMPRNTRFCSPRHAPLSDQPFFELRHDHVHGPLSFFNPTRARFRHKGAMGQDPSGGDQPATPKENGSKDEMLADDVEFKWRSRDNRKGRHTLLVHPSKDKSHARFLTPELTATFRGALKGIGRMCTQYPYYDVSYLVAIIFTWGSIVWVLNAFFVWLPLVKPSTEFPNEISSGGGITAFLGATIFEIGSILLMIESVNENRSGCFGWALERAISHDRENGELLRLVPDKHGCLHHHQNRKNFVGKPALAALEGKVRHKNTTEDDSTLESTPKVDGSGAPPDAQSWVWFPTWHELTTHYFREIGFLASLSQFVGATIFWIAGFTALPGVIDSSNIGLEDGVYWTPQVVGGTGFIISGILFMLETQPNWYTPAFGTLGWHIGFWNLVGAVGFTLSGALGYSSSSGAVYESSLATFWGSWAFLIGSVIQWYESLDKHPVETSSSKS